MKSLAEVSIELEQDVLGTLLLAPSRLDAVRRAVDADEFSEPIHQAIFSTMVSISDMGGTITPTTIKGAIGAQAHADMGGLTLAEYLARLMADAATNSTLSGASSATMVRRIAKLRQIEAATADASQIIAELGSAADPSRLASDVMAQLDIVLSAHSDLGTERVDAAEAAGRALRAMDEAERLKGRIPGVTWGFPAVDRMTSGMMPGELLILAGRPGMGKTTFGLAAAIRAAQSGAGVAIFSLEMSEVSLAQRAISDLAFRADAVNVTYFDIRRGFVPQALRDRVNKAAEAFGRLPLMIEQESGLSVAQVMARSRQIARTLAARGAPLKVVVIDHIGLLRASSRYAGQRVNEVSEMTAALKAFAKNMGVAVLALSQLNRGVEGREDKRPQLSDLRDSGSIEQDADAVFGAYRHAYYLERAMGDQENADLKAELEQCKHSFELLVLKQRNGAVGRIPLGIDVACNHLW